MRNSLLIGLTVGTVMGMVIASKNRAVVQKVNEAEDALNARSPKWRDRIRSNRLKKALCVRQAGNPKKGFPAFSITILKKTRQNAVQTAADMV